MVLKINNLYVECEGCDYFDLTQVHRISTRLSNITLWKVSGVNGALARIRSRDVVSKFFKARDEPETQVEFSPKQFATLVWAMKPREGVFIGYEGTKDTGQLEEVIAIKVKPHRRVLVRTNNARIIREIKDDLGGLEIADADF